MKQVLNKIKQPEWSLNVSLTSGSPSKLIAFNNSANWSTVVFNCAKYQLICLAEALYGSLMSRNTVFWPSHLRACVRAVELISSGYQTGKYWENVCDVLEIQSPFWYTAWPHFNRIICHSIVNWIMHILKLKSERKLIQVCCRYQELWLYWVRSHFFLPFPPW